MKLQQLFEESLDKPFYTTLHSLILDDEAHALASLAHLQDSETGDTLLHIVLRKLNTYNERPRETQAAAQLTFCVCLAKKLLQDPSYTSNIFLANNNNETPFLLMTPNTTWILSFYNNAYVAGRKVVQGMSSSGTQAQYKPEVDMDNTNPVDNSTLGSVPLYFTAKWTGTLVNANDAQLPWSDFNQAAMGEVISNDLDKIVELKYQYAKSNHALMTVSIFDIMVMNAHYTQANALAVKMKMAKHVNPVGHAKTVVPLNIQAQDLLDEKAFNQSPLTQHRNMFFSWKHGNTYSVQQIFAIEKKKLIREALGDSTSLTDENMTRIFQNLVRLLFPARGNYSREVLRRPMGKSDIRGYFSNDADTQSYNLILAVLQALAPTYDFEGIWMNGREGSVADYTITLYMINDPTAPTNTLEAKKGLSAAQRDALNQLAVYAGLQEDHYSQDELIQTISRTLAISRVQLGN